MNGKWLTKEHIRISLKLENNYGNITNPNSIYIKLGMKFKGYQKYHIHGYIDTGASICVANEYILPSNLWEKSLNKVAVQIADGNIIYLEHVARNIKVEIAGNDFIIPTVYKQNSGMDFIIGNNFLRLYNPFIQYEDRIVIHDKDTQEPVIVQKVSKAMTIANEKLMEKLAKPLKRGEKQILKGKNIAENNTEMSPNETILLFSYIEKEQIEINPSNKDWNEYILSYRLHEEIQKAFENISSDNPLDIDMNKLLKNTREHAEIKLKDENKVIRVKPMVYTPDDREFFRKEIKELLDKRIIRESKSPHSSPAFLVQNHSEIKRGKKRMVINYKKLNSETIDDGYYLPKKEELIGMIRGKKYYSSFDCKSGFWQIPLKEECRCLTAFSCPTGQYEWNVIPFGLKQAPGLFQRHMDTKLDLKDPLQDIGKYTVVYVDDILVFSDNEKEHSIHVLNVLNKCREKGIILSKTKAQIAVTKINFLGLEISEGTHKLQDHILNKIQAFPSKIDSKNQLQRFLGCLTYAEGYIPKLAEIRKPLQAKLKNNVIFSWNNEDTLYVDKIKKNFGTLPELYHPKETDYLILETDASNDNWGAVLKAKTEDGELLCRYTSGSFQGSELNYHSNEKETLAVKKAIKKFAIYLLPAEFTVRCDNKNFGYFLRTNIAGDYKQGRLLRWQQWFNHYKFKVEYIKGINNCLADAMTREFSQIKI